jgi:hypothetical protein
MVTISQEILNETYAPPATSFLRPAVEGARFALLMVQMAQQTCKVTIENSESIKHTVQQALACEEGASVANNGLVESLPEMKTLLKALQNAGKQENTCKTRARVLRGDSTRVSRF